jgi:predicted ester cyclase
MPVEQLKNLAYASFRVIETGDVGLAEQTLDEDFVNHEADDDPEDAERQTHGPAGFLATSTWLREAFSDLCFQHREAAVDGHTVLAATVMTGRHTGAFQGLPPSGRGFRQDQVHIFTTLDGRITSHRAVRDDLGLILQLGWQPSSDPS